MKRSAARGGKPLAGRHILIVSGDADSRQILRMALEFFGALVAVAPTAERALVMAENVKPDAIVTDLAPRRKDAAWLLTRVRAIDTLEDLPMIAVTGQPEREHELRASGFTEVVIKPVDPATLRRVLTNILSRRT